tara:strand:+ start:1288 stop:1557 length:270 start_codon:yes stop_codon:yes gene_type:complete
MYTRKQRLDNECSHREYFAQFVSASLPESIADSIGKDRLLKSNDEHLNDIPLKCWDRLHGYFAGRANWSLSDSVCSAKEAARQWIEANQ